MMSEKKFARMVDAIGDEVVLKAADIFGQILAASVETKGARTDDARMSLDCAEGMIEELRERLRIIDSGGDGWVPGQSTAHPDPC